MTPTSGSDPLRDRLQARLGAQYEILGLLGQGGMGSVFRARDLTLEREVAIKVIGGETNNAELRQRFLQEARTVAKLRHPNIVAVYSAGDAEGLLYFVMELVPGESLRDLLSREGRVAPARAERILHELSLALDVAHSSGVVHRDVKPENILLDRDSGRAMLTDFGVARALEGDGRMTGTGMILGSPKYMSPEQASGESTLDGRSDLYSLALVGYEMFTGKAVVESANIAGMLVKHLTETPVPLQQAAIDVPEGVAVAIDRALEKDRAQRWATGREMAEVIGMAWTPGAIAGTGQRTGMRTGVAGRTLAGLRGGGASAQAARKRWIAVAAGTAVALSGAAWALLAGGDGPPRGVDPRRSFAVMPFEVQAGDADVQWLRDGAVNMLTLAMSQWSDLTIADYERTMVLVRDAGLEAKRVDLDRALGIARRARAWTVVTGTITTTADSLRVDARLFDVASGRALETKTLAGARRDDPRPLFDDLARYLLGVAGGTANEGLQLAAATTTSLVAYRSYLDGVRLLFGWRLPEADSAFQVAIRADSTFALAWHKRSLALGWLSATGGGYLESAQRAAELAGRLPPREQALVHGHHRLAVGLNKSFSTGASGRADYQAAESIYTALIARDSTVAEAWYGLADALVHDDSRTDSADVTARRVTRSVRGFHRTLALDSTFHLAYQHLVQVHQNLSGAGGLLVLDGDSVRVVGTEAQVRAAGGPAAVAAMRERASRAGLEMTKLWLRADQDAPTPYQSLATGFLNAGHADSALQVMQAAAARPTLRTLSTALWTSYFRAFADDAAAPDSMRATLDKATVAQLSRLGISERLQILGAGISIAGLGGNGKEVEARARLFASIDSVFPNSQVSTWMALRPYVDATKIAMSGTMSPELRRGLLRSIAIADSIAGPLGQQVRGTSISVPYVAFLVTHDTLFAGVAQRWSQQGTRYPEIEARIALERGDTAAARTIAATFASADSVRKSRLGLAGMRTIARAELLEELGDVRGAADLYDALAPERFALSFLADPGFAVYARSFAARARLREQLGERERAIAAWEHLLALWRGGDALTEPLRKEGEAALRRLRDAPR